MERNVCERVWTSLGIGYCHTEKKGLDHISGKYDGNMKRFHGMDKDAIRTNVDKLIPLNKAG